MSELIHNQEPEKMENAFESVLSQNYFRDFEFNTDGIIDFFDSLNVNPPPLADNLTLYRIDNYLFSSNIGGFYPIGTMNPEEWKESEEASLKQQSNFELDTDTEEDDFETQDFQFGVDNRDSFIGFIGFGFNSWNFVYKYLSTHLRLNIHISLVSIFSPEEVVEVHDHLLELCYKIIQLCLYLENQGEFFEDEFYDKLYLTINNENTAFLIVDKNFATCKQGNSIEELFSFIERKFEAKELKGADSPPWIRI